MKTHFQRCLSAFLGLALALPVASMTMGQDSEDEPRSRVERQDDDGARDENNKRDRDDDRDRDNRDTREEARDDEAPANNERAPRSIRTERRTNVNADNVQGSPSDMPAQPAPIHPQPMHQAQAHHSGGFVSNNCCCNNGGVVYSQNNGYRSARMNNGGYRSFSYQGGDDAVNMNVQASPAPVMYGNGYSNGFNNRGYYGGVQNGANWDRHNEHDSRNFSGSYGSRASLRSN